MTARNRYVFTPSQSPRQQRGALLIVSLILLMMLSTLGAAVMRSSTLEEKMAANNLHRDRAFQAAETAAVDAISDTNNFTSAMDKDPKPAVSQVDMGNQAISSQARTYFVGTGPAPGYSQGSGGSSYMAYRFVIEGEGTIDQVSTDSGVVRGAYRIAPAP